MIIKCYTCTRCNWVGDSPKITCAIYRCPKCGSGDIKRQTVELEHEYK